MKYYKITIGGVGAEIYPFKINEEQFQILNDEGVEFDNIDYDNVCEILEIDSYLDCSEETIMGTYSDELHLKVEDENGEVIHQIGQVDYDNVDFENKFCDDDLYLLIEDYCKGDHIVYDIPLGEEFDIKKLKLSLTNIGDMIELVTGITYNGEDYHIYKGYGNTSSKGYNHYLK